MIKLANTIVYDMHEAAAMLHCHENTIARYIKAGTLRAQKVGRKWYITDKTLAEMLTGESAQKPQEGEEPHEVNL